MAGEVVKIYADTRERRSKVVEILEARGAEVLVDTLPVGDYILSERVVVERKTAHDFLASITRKRLYRQLDEMKRNFETPLLLIEGKNLYGLRRLHPDLIRQALALITVVNKIPVIFTSDVEDTACFLYIAARQEQWGLDKRVSLRGEKKPVLMEERQLYVVESLPQIGPQLAERLLHHFGSIERIVSATEEELRQVPRIGPKKAREIKALLAGRFGARDTSS